MKSVKDDFVFIPDYFGNVFVHQPEHCDEGDQLERFLDEG